MIPRRVLDTAPMLAETASRGDPRVIIARLEQHGGWSFEPKWDGHRCRAVVTETGARLFSRSGTDITRKHPQVVDALRAAIPNGVVLDGELVCFGPDGRPDVYSVNRRGSSTTYVAFDLLYDDEDLRSEPYDVRMRHLDLLAEQFDRVRLQRTMTALDGAALWDAVTEIGLEGIMAKRRQSRYVGRRTDDWLKIKVTQRISALVADAEPGSGSRRATFGALHLHLRRGPDDWVEVGKVGSGFSDRDLMDVVRHILSGEPLIIDVEFASVTPDGQLREPVFKGIREDLTPADCQLSQII